MTGTPSDPVGGSAGFPPGRWRGRWIGAPDGAVRDGRRVALFRRVFELAEVPPSLLVRVTAETRYVLVVNGAEVARGPARSQPLRRLYDLLDLAPHLRPGRNVLAAAVVSDPEPTPWSLPSLAPSLRSGGLLIDAVAPDAPVRTCADWSVRQLASSGTVGDLGPSGRRRELLDAAELASSWASREDGWIGAVELAVVTQGEVADPSPPHFPSGPHLASPLTPRSSRGVRLTRAQDGSLVAPGIVAGTLRLDVEGPPGGRVEIDSSELGSARDPGRGCTVVTAGARHVIETFDVHGLDRVRVTTSGGAVLHGVEVRERLHPVTGGASFVCSDGELNAIFDAGRRTVSLCSQDAYVDCPTREQRAWTGDLVVHQMVDLVTNDDWTLARWAPRLAASPRPDGMLPMAVAGDVEGSDVTIIPDWALHWVHAVHNLHRYVGDRDEIAALLPIAEGVLRWFEPFLAGGVLRAVVGWVLIDWAAIPTGGACAALCGLYARALWEMAEMAEWLGDHGRARWARERHREVAAGFEVFWDAARGRYADAVVAGQRGVSASQHAQAAAIVGRVAPSSRLPRLVEVLTDQDALVAAVWGIDGPALPGTDADPGYLASGQPAPWWDVDRLVVAAQPFFRYVVHDALAAAGEAHRIAAACRDWRRIVHAGSLREVWHGGTASHGWSATPTRDLVQRVLGIEPAEPGCAVMRVAPHLGGLAWARGSAPTPHGRVHVDVTERAIHVVSPVPVILGEERLEAGEHRRPLGSF